MQFPCPMMIPSSLIHARIFHHLPKCQKKKRSSSMRSLMMWSKRLRLQALRATKSQPCQLRRKGLRPSPRIRRQHHHLLEHLLHPHQRCPNILMTSAGLSILQKVVSFVMNPGFGPKPVHRNTNGLTFPRIPSARFATSLRTPQCVSPGNQGGGVTIFSTHPPLPTSSSLLIA